MRPSPVDCESRITWRVGWRRSGCKVLSLLALMFLYEAKLERFASAAPRTWVGALSSDWHTSGNWLQQAVPSGDDNVTISVLNTTVLLSTDTAPVNSLSISSGGDLFTNGSRLLVDSPNTATTTISGAGTRIIVEASNAANAFNTDRLEIKSAGTLELDDGVVLVDGVTTVEDSATIRGFGEFETSQLNMNGRVQADGGTLTLLGPANVLFDLDGDQNDGVLDAIDGSLSIAVAQIDEFAGTFNVGAARSLTIETSWKLLGGANRGELNLIGGATQATAAVLADPGGNAIVELDGDVNVTGFARIAVGTRFMSSAIVQIQQSDDRLVLEGDTDIQGGSFTGLGTLRIAGQADIASNLSIGVAVEFDTNAAVDVAQGAVLSLNDPRYEGGVIAGAGTLRQEGDAVVNGDTTINTATFDWDGAGQSTTTIDGATFTINSSAIQDPADGDAFHGSIDILDGTLLVNTPNPWRLSGALTLQIQAGPAVPTVGGAADLIVEQSGLLQGNGQLLVSVDNSGTLAPGASPGSITIRGDYVQGDQGDLEIELGGTASGSFDRLVVDGLAVLDGTLTIHLLDDFLPAFADEFSIIASGGTSGAFRRLINNVLPDGRTLRTRYSQAGVVLLVTVTGDTDMDGDVDIQDLNNVRNNFGGTGSPILGDTNDDNDVDISDLNAVRNNFGRRAGAPSVPEPSAWTLASIAIVGLIRCQRRR